MKLRNQAMLLILAEVFFIVTSAFWDAQLEGGYWLTAIYFTFFSMGGYAIAQDKKWLYQYAVLCVIALTFNLFDSYYVAELVACICTLLAHLMVFRLLVWHSFFRKKVLKSDKILSGIAGYILLGLFWTGIFMFMGKEHPGCLLNQVSGAPTSRADELYYSFVTITSLGYGDIVPVSPAAKVAATFAGLSGVLFTAIFISALVSNLKGRVAEAS
ncbi:potassium channel family protein [Rubritalea tangerina]|uniref:Potassium channel family protein n=1 Tax=Rubritalea tangerina TaxID=430798 RepID=A0ABW4ZCF4_9BACT